MNCANCRKDIKEHRAVNFSDGNMITVPVLICPRNIFVENEKTEI